jgi:hypothetical protein
MISHRKYSLLSIIALLAVHACGRNDSMASPTPSLTPGTWGSSEAQVVVTDSMTIVRVGCGEGHFTYHIETDASGVFAVSGTWVRNNQQAGTPLPADFSGQVVGTTLTFAVASGNDGVNPVNSTGPQTVVLNATWPGALCTS